MASAMGELRYYSGRAVSGSLAYERARARRERELSHAGEMPRHREQGREQPKVRRVAKVQVRQAQKVSAVTVVGFGTVIALSILVLMSYIQLMVLSAGTVELQSELTALEAENVTLTTQYEQMFDLASVKEAAEAAGMAKPSSSQVFYIDLSDRDSAVVYQEEEPSVLSRLLASVSHGVYAVVEYFD